MLDHIIQIISVEFDTRTEWEGNVRVTEVHGLTRSGRMYRWTGSEWDLIASSPELETGHAM